MEEKGALRRERIQAIVFVFCCIVINFVGNFINGNLSLPVWLDTFGTVIAAYVLGPVCGAIVGASSNIVLSFWDGTSLAYGIKSILISLSVGYAARKKYFETIFHVMTVAGLVTIVSVIISSSLNLLIYDGSTGNIWGDGVRDYFITRGIPSMIAAFIGQFYLEFSDKLITILGFYTMLRIYRRIRSWLSKDGEKPEPPSGAKVGAIALFLTVAAALSLSCPTLTASAEEADAPSNSYIRTIYNAENGLECGHANDVVQTNDGIIWVGSYSGLYRYNGTTFRFMNEFSTVKNVNCLYVDAEGRLWIGTNDNGVVVAINQKEANSLDSSHGLPSDSVKSITQSADGDYYIGTSDKLVVARLRTGFAITDTIDDLLYVKKLSSDSKGSVAAVTASGKLYIIRKGSVAYEIAAPEGTGYTCCTFAPDDTLYAGTADGQVLLMEAGETKAQMKSTVMCDDLSGLNRIYLQDENTAWILSDSGIGTVSEGKVYRHMETEGFNYSLENMTIDYQGNLWIASSRMGLMQLSESAFSDLFSDYGLEAGVVNTTARKDSKLYIGTDKGLIVIDEKSKKEIENDLTKLLSEARIRCIESDSDGNLWICSYGEGLIEVTKSGKIIAYDSEEDGIGSRVRVCMQLSNGAMAIGGDKGLYFIEGGKVTKKMLYGEELGAAKILCLYETPDGSLLAGTDGNGIDIIKDGSVIGHYAREEGLSSGVILRMVGDVDKNDVFIAAGNGLCYLRNGRIVPIKNFPYSNNYDLVLDDDGDLFVPGSAGIYVLNRDQLMSEGNPHYLLLNSRSGLRGSLTSNAWNAIDEDKNIYLSTDRGVFVVNMDEYQPKKKFYRMLVSEVLLDNNSAHINQGFDLVIDQDVTSVEIVPEVVNYTLENPYISYCLEGIDNTWKTVRQDELSHIVYTHLPAGHYLFRIAMLDPESGSAVEECVYGFQKETAIYENTGFLVYLIVIGIIFAAWLTWFITSRRIQRTMALQQAKLSLALQQIQMGNETILAIAKTVDAKDIRTSQHSQRVSDYSVMIAREYGFSKDELENLRKSALLHDIGKIGIPDAILNKPARLTDEEYGIMKTHVTRGAEILKDFTLIEHAVDGARYHHERYDGRGYPDHLSGKEIPLYGRIIAIADAFDAMTANRVYRKQQDFDYVMGELKRGRGTQFDPELLDIFLKLIDDGMIDIKALYSTKTPAAEESQKQAENKPAEPSKEDVGKKTEDEKEQPKKEDGKDSEKKGKEDGKNDN